MNTLFLVGALYSLFCFIGSGANALGACSISETDTVDGEYQCDGGAVKAKLDSFVARFQDVIDRKQHMDPFVSEVVSSFKSATDLYPELVVSLIERYYFFVDTKQAKKNSVMLWMLINRIEGASRSSDNETVLVRLNELLYLPPSRAKNFLIELKNIFKLPIDQRRKALDEIAFRIKPDRAPWATNIQTLVRTKH
jgi:hypothetical protein